ncbi:hypothetical protein BANRA_00817 [Escherichia coli]|nr:hypothetical protein BANRA_00817 [Escherichia coli]VCY70939.1 hypothetical protein BANRA_03376 [Escherichia coli]
MIMAAFIAAHIIHYAIYPSNNPIVLMFSIHIQAYVEDDFFEKNHINAL